MMSGLKVLATIGFTQLFLSLTYNKVGSLSIVPSCPEFIFEALVCLILLAELC